MSNQFGICEWSFPVQGPEAIRWASRLGYDGIQIAEQGGYDAGFPLADPKMADEYKRTIEENPITLQALHLWSGCRMPCMIHPVDSACGRIGVECVEKAVEACTLLGIDKIMLTSGFMSQIKNRQDFEIFASHLKLDCQIAGEKDITIVFESALSVDEIREMRQIVGNDLKICYDILNPLRFNMGNPWEEIPELGLEAIDHFHMKDMPETGLGCTLLGDGIGHYKDSVDVIRKVGYKGWFITENYYAQKVLSDIGDFDTVCSEDLRRMRNDLGGSR